MEVESEGNQLYDKYIKKPGYDILCLKRDFPESPDSMTVDFLRDVSIDIYEEHYKPVDIVLVSPDHFSSLIRSMPIDDYFFIPGNYKAGSAAIALPRGMAKVYEASEVAKFEAVFINEGKGISFLVLDL